MANSSGLITGIRMAITLARNAVTTIWTGLGTIVARGTVLT